MQLRNGWVIFLFGLVSCNETKTSDKWTEKSDVVIENSDTVESLTELTLPDTLPNENGNAGRPQAAMRQLLLHPLDLEAYKKEYGISNSSSRGKRELFNTPDTIGFMYQYMFFPKLLRVLPNRVSESELFDAFSITTFKLGREVGDFYDTNEVLMAIECGLDNPTLGSLNVFGLTEKEVLIKYGPPQYREENLIFYQLDDRVFAVHFNEEEKACDWYKFIRLNPTIDLSKEVPSFFEWKI